jgi:hypothetical protein
VRSDRVSQLAGVVDLVDRHQHLGRDLLVELDVLLELGHHGAGQRLNFLVLPRLFADHLGVRLEERLVVGEAHNARALATLDKHLDRAVRQLQQLQHGADRADRKNVGSRRVVLRRVFLRDEKDLLVVLHHVFECPHRFLAADEQRHDHVREHHDVSQWQNRIKRSTSGFEHRTSFFARGRRRQRRQPVDKP